MIRRTAGGAGGDSHQPALVGGLCICGPGVAPQAMAFHKFKIGQRVSYRPSGAIYPIWCVVTGLLPERDGEFKYRIRRQGAAADLMVGESDLRENREL